MKGANGKGLVINVTVKAPPQTIPGDVDGSGVVDVDDALLLQKHIAKYTDGGKPLIDENDEAVMNIADVNRDGLLSVSDVTMIQKYIAGIIPGFGEA